METSLVKNMAHTSGAFKWAKMLRERIQRPWEKFRLLFGKSVKTKIRICSKRKLHFLSLLIILLNRKRFIFHISRPAEGVDMVTEYSMYTEILNLLDQFEKDIYSDWCCGLEQTCLINLNQPLISRNTSSGLISVNFNPKVTNFMEIWKCTPFNAQLTLWLRACSGPLLRHPQDP